jgi:hypothetical protein
MHDPGHPARAVGKRISLLRSGKAPGLSALQEGISAGPGADETPERDADQDQLRFPTHESGARQAAPTRLLAGFPFARS